MLRIIAELISYLKIKIGLFYKISEIVSLVDMLYSFAVTADKHDYRKSNYSILGRPEFSTSLVIKRSKHPIIDIVSKSKCVSNDIASYPASNFTFTTGPNMSGKTTYLKTIALLTIMAQIGS